MSSMIIYLVIAIPVTIIAIYELVVQHFEKKSMTIASAIRNMSDHELAKFLASMHNNTKNWRKYYHVLQEMDDADDRSLQGLNAVNNLYAYCKEQSTYYSCDDCIFCGKDGCKIAIPSEFTLHSIKRSARKKHA